MTASITPTTLTQVITDLIELARRINLALDDSEEFEGSDGRTHAITAQHFDDICDAIHWLEALPDNKPGETLSPAGKAEWALRDLIQAPMGAPSADTLYLLRRLLSNQHTLTGSEFRAELTTIVQAAIERQPPSVARGLRPTDLVNAAGILASDSPGAVVKKLEAAYDRATLKGGA